MDSANIMRGLFGLAALVAIGWGLSSHRKKVDPLMVATLLAGQILLALVLLKVPFVSDLFSAITAFFVQTLDFTTEGTRLLLGDKLGAPGEFGFIFLFHVLPTIIFFSALTSALYYLGVLQWIIYVIAWVLHRVGGISGAESLAAAANVFVGQTEAPLVVKPYIEKMTRSEVMCLMTGGMATIAGGVFVAYIGLLGGTSNAEKLDVGRHLLAASLISAPAAILAAKLLIPETEKVDTQLMFPGRAMGSNLLDAICQGTTEGVKLCVNVAAMLLVFTAMIAMVNFGLRDLLGEWTGLNELIATQTGGQFEGLTLQFLLGLLLAPVAWLIGVGGEDVMVVGRLLGEKTILNEFIAYDSMAKLGTDGFVHEKSRIIAMYACCGFANFASIGIQIGGISVLAPGRRVLLTELGVKALIGGTLACLMTACVAGMLI